MSVRTIEGTYKDGKVELSEMPEGVEEAHVLMTFFPPEHAVDERRREALRLRFLDRLKRGVDFGTEPLPTWEELYAERLDRYQ